MLEEPQRAGEFQTGHRQELDLRVLLELVRQRAMPMAQPGPLAPWEPAQEQLAKPSERQKVLMQQEQEQEQEASCYPMV